ncbi:MAG: Demethylmenaquinone methyltransferase [Chloroflexi bacterium]|nr:Demethylmenaquinone methyltransferase [Chloroflexota bacterium]
MFARIAPKYDFMNRLITGGQDARWRKIVLDRAALPPNALVLDLGTGTGDLAGEVAHRHPDSRVIAADFTLPMMCVGRRKYSTPQIAWNAADALQLPFPKNTFDAVISGFLLRNVADLPRGLSEQYRVLKPGGKFVSLDTTQPTPNLFSPLIKFYMRVVIPTLGRLFTGYGDAYTYLPESSENFLRAERLTAHLAAAGFRKILYERTMFGTIAIHWGEK